MMIWGSMPHNSTQDPLGLESSLVIHEREAVIGLSVMSVIWISLLVAEPTYSGLR